MKRFGTVLVAALLATACAEDKPANKPMFVIGEQGFNFTMPEGFCTASKDWERSFSSTAAQNSDKQFLAKMVDCVENARYANSPNYILLMAFSDPARQKIDKAGLMKGYEPNMDPKQFAELLAANKSFDELKAVVGKKADSPFGREGYLFPEVYDENCVFSGGYYGQPPLTPENRGAVMNCIASIGGYQFVVMYNADGKQDPMDMARRVSRMIGSIKLVEK